MVKKKHLPFFILKGLGKNSYFYFMNVDLKINI